MLTLAYQMSVTICFEPRYPFGNWLFWANALTNLLPLKASAMPDYAIPAW